MIMSNKAKPCPFCGCIFIEIQTNRHLFIEQIGFVYYLNICCTGCGAQLKDVREPTFNECSKFTVQDFRDDPTLRHDVQIELNRRVSVIKSQLLSLWNERTKE